MGVLKKVNSIKMYTAEAPETQTKKERITKLFPTCVVRILSIIQLVCAVLAFVLQMLVLSNHNSCNGPDCFAYVGTGFWTGIFFGISGGIGVLVSQRPSHCNITAFMVMNIFSSLFCIPLLTFAVFGFAHDGREGNGKFLFGYGLQIIIALVQAVTTILASGYSCRVVCCIKKANPGRVEFSQQNVPHQILYNTQTIQNPSIVPPNAPPMNYALNSLGHQSQLNSEAVNLASRLPVSERPPTYSTTTNDPKQ